MTLPVLIILAVLWAVVLLPPLLRSRSQRSADSIVDFNYKLDMLGRTNGNRRSFRRRAAGAGATGVPPIARRRLSAAATPRLRVPGLRVDPGVRSAKRRRDVLRVLGFAFLVTLLDRGARRFECGVGAADLRRRVAGRVSRVVGVGAQRAGRAHRQGALHAGAASAGARAAAQRVLVVAGGPALRDRRDRRPGP